ncbi:thiaminase II [Brackiella oedipodis]|uniref:thiaminase II n=1 Tax=Brackiella oedipodis TaxID=124225 RepID=UPI000490BF22|nr:thiaminase II [Brackiella oedipodis]
MSFTKELWQANLPLFEATVQHPFNQALAQGTLKLSAFKHYVIQDAHYLLAYARALAITGAKADLPEDVIQFTNAAQEAIVVERSLHDGFMQDFGITKQSFTETPLTQACDHYTLFLQACAWSQPYAVTLAAILPCFWIYAEVGNAILAQSVKDNPYQKWIDTYAGEEFQEAVRKVLATIDRVAEQADDLTRQKMHQAYKRAAELEWLFWDSAYHERTWPDMTK